MRKRLVAAILTAALLMTNTGVVYAAETTETDTVSIQSGEESVVESGETDEDKMDSADVEAKGNFGEADVLNTEDAENMQSSEDIQNAQIERAAGEYNYTVVDGKAAITKYNGSGGSVVIPETINGAEVTEIGESAFRGLTAVTEVVIPDSVQEIKKEAFRDCTGIEKVTLSKNLTYIGAAAFYGCSLLTAIEIPAALDKTADEYDYTGPFAETGLKTVTFEEGAAQIAQRMFKGCTSLEEIFIPDTVTQIDREAFMNCSGLRSVDFGNSVEAIEDSAFEGCSSLTKALMPDTVTRVEEEAFKENTSLSEVKLSGNLSYLGAGAFRGCELLTAIEIPAALDKAADEYDYTGPFAETGLKKVTFGDGIPKIAQRLFKDCTTLEEITLPDSVEEIEYAAFRNCSSLKKIDIPDGVIRIENEAFLGDSALSEVELSDHLEYIGTAAFRGCELLTSIEIPASLDKTADEYDYTGPFAETGLKTVTFAEGATQIAQRLFRDCKLLEEIIIPDTVTQIDREAFMNCTALRSVDLGNGVEAIEDSAFENCSSLIKVVMPDTVTRVEKEAFKENTSLSEVKLSGNLSYLGAGAFRGCELLTEIEIPAALDKAADEYDYTGPFAETGLKQVTFADGIPKIAQRLFKDCTSLEEITLPDSVEEIGYSAFRNCSSLKKIDIPDGVIRIENEAFSGDSSLSEVELSDHLEYIGTAAFHGCELLTSIEIPASLDKTADEYDYTGPFAETGLKTVTFAEGATQIAQRLFRDCKLLEEIIIPDTVTEIDREAFMNCTSLKSVGFGNRVEKIGAAAFKNCISIKKVELPDTVVRLEKEAFSGNTALNDVILSNNLEYIGTSAFYGCKLLTSIEIPASLKSTSDEYDYTGPFAETNLRKVTFEEGCTIIPKKLFANCQSLTELEIPEEITEIQSRAFENCHNLLSLSLSDNITKCDINAFSGCEKIILLCNYGVPVHIYAIENCLPVNLISYAYDDFSDLAIERDCTYSIDYNSLQTNGYVKVTLHYNIKPDKFNTAKDKSMKFFVPENSDYFEDTLYVNGELSYDHEIDGRILTVHLTEPEGDITFGFSPETVEDLSTAAIFQYKDNGETKKELAGFDNSSRSILSINAETVVSKDEVEVQGLAGQSAEIELYLDGILQTTVNASKTGKYKAKLKLSEPENGKIYIIEARNSNAQDQVAQTQVRYNDAAPVLTDFKLYYNNHSDTVIDLMNTESKPYISFNPQVPFTFVADFDNTEEIENVYIVSTRNNERKIMEAQYDEDKGQYIASGYFDDNNHSYVPSNLTVEYNLRKEEVQVGQEVDWTGMYNSLPENLKKAQITEIKGENGETCYRFDMSQVAEGFQDVVVDLTISEISKVTGIGVDEWFDAYKDAFGYAGYVIPGLSGERYDAVTSSDGLKMGLVVAKDLTNITNDAVKIELEFQSPGSYGTLNEFSETLGTIAPFVSAASDIYGFAQDKDQLITEINQSPTITNKGEARQKAEQLFNDQMMYTLLVAMLPLLVASVGITGPVATAFTGLLAMIGATSSFFWEARVNNIKGNEFSIRWGIDPSGYVYEAVEDNRIEGVKTTAYYKENAEDEEAILWDASEYEQRNPLYTDTEGRYSWDVPEGYWQVKYEKEGYETVYSDWMPVPPPQTDVNIGLVSKEKPVIESFTVYADHADVVFSKYMIPDTVSSLKLSDQNGNDISYELEYDTTSVNSEGINYAKEYTLRFTGNSVLTPESTCRLTADGSAKSYADVAMDAGETETVVNKNIEIIAPDKAVVKMGETLEIPVMVANASEELSFTAVSEFEEIASVTEIGENSIKVTGNMYGEADITISVPGTDLVKTIRVTVGKTTEEAEVTPTVVLPQSVYTMKAGDELTVTPEVYPETAEGSWSIISGEDVIAVKGNTFTAKKSGEAVLRYTLAEYEDVFAECRIIVEADGDVVRGDADGNKTVDIADLRMVLRAVCGKVDFTEQQKLAADVTDDGRVDIQDLRKILRYVCRKIDEL